MNRDRLLRWLVLIAVVVTIIMNGLANSLPFNGLDTGEISDRFEVYFVPAGYVFSIWGLIYLGLIAFGIYQILPANSQNPRLDRISGWFLLSSVGNISWLFLWHYLIFEGTIVAMLVILISLIMIYLRLETGQSSVNAGEFWLVRVPFSIYLGWITVATIANFTTLLDYLQWGGWGIPDATWAVIMLAIATVLGWVMALTRKDLFYLAVLIWAFIGIAVKHQATQLVAVSAWLAAGLVAVAGVVAGVNKLRQK